MNRCDDCGHEEPDHLPDDDWCVELRGNCVYQDVMSGGCDCRQFVTSWRAIKAATDKEDG